MKKLYLLLIISIFLSGCSFGKHDNTVNENNNLPEEEGIISSPFTYKAQLTDVSGGQFSGIARANFADNVYILEAQFVNLPDLEEGYFYEGWLVKNDPLDVVSTGEAVKKEGAYTNTYITEKDLTDHDFYVLTLEPDDGNPGPDKHILEGSLEKIAVN